MVRNIKDKVALVTGAASGIGRETALLLAERGAQLILCDLNQEGLQDIEHAVNGRSKCLLARTVDVSDSNLMQEFAREVHAQVPALDILVNNAGIGLAGNLLDTSLADWQRVLGINLMGVIHGCHFFAPKMVERGEGGHIVNVSSVFGYFASPRVIGYITSKHAVLGFTEALRLELREAGIGVSAICPGVINTNIISSTVFRGYRDEEAVRSHVQNTYQKRNYGPEKVGKAILSAIRWNRALVPVAPEAWSLYWLRRFLPRTSRWAARVLHKKLGV